MASIQLTQLQAARRQFQTAVELWVSGGDAVSIHTLAFCAYQIIHDINRQRRGPPLLLDNPAIDPSKKQAWVNAVKEFPNYFKHADGRKTRNQPAQAEFDDERNLPLLAFSLIGLQVLGEQLTRHEVAFKALLLIKRPELSTEDTTRMIQQSFDAQAVAALGLLPNDELFNKLLKIAIPVTVVVH